MKKLLLISIFILYISITNRASLAETKTVIAQGTFSVTTVFSLEFYTDANVFYSNAIPFTNMAPTSTHVQADGRTSGDGKNDVGLLCSTNLNETWYFKISGAPVSPFTLDKMKYYFGQPWNRSFNPPWGGAPADGILAVAPGWYNVPSSSTVIYTAGTRDKSNLPGGTLCLFSFAINPGGLDANKTYNCNITYTLTLSP